MLVEINLRSPDSALLVCTESCLSLLMMILLRMGQGVRRVSDKEEQNMIHSVAIQTEVKKRDWQTLVENQHQHELRVGVTEMRLGMIMMMMLLLVHACVPRHLWLSGAHWTSFW